MLLTVLLGIVYIALYNIEQYEVQYYIQNMSILYTLVNIFDVCSYM